MTIQYKIEIDTKTNEPCAITIIGQNISIPINEANTDYQAYLKWVSEGNEPLPADE
jgi:hypothetical protein